MACTRNFTITVKDAVSKLMELYLEPKFQIDSECWVHLTHIEDPHLFYVRPIEYKLFLTVIEAPTSQYPDDINIGMIFIYQSKLLNKWVRGRVVSIKDGVLDMFAIDYGCLDEGVNKKLITCKHSEDNIPGLAYKATLGHCYPVNGQHFSREAIEHFKYYAKRNAAEMKILNKIGENIVVELTVDGPPDVATLLAFAGYICFTPVTISRPAQKEIKMFKKQTLLVGDVKHVRVLLVKSKINFYVADTKDYAANSIQKIKLTKMPGHKCISKPEELKPGAAVIVYSEALNYERAQVVDITCPPNVFKVKLVDIGTEIETSDKYLKEIPDGFLELPPIAIQCLSANIDERVLQVGNEFTMRIVRVPDKCSVRTEIELVE